MPLHNDEIMGAPGGSRPQPPRHGGTQQGGAGQLGVSEKFPASALWKHELLPGHYITSLGRYLPLPDTAPPNMGDGRQIGFIIPVNADRENYQSTAISMTQLREATGLIALLNEARRAPPSIFIL